MVNYSLVDQAVVKFQAGDVEDSIQILQQGLVKNCCDPELWQALGFIYTKTGKVVLGLSAYRCVTRYAPLSASSYAELAQAYQQSGDTQRSLECLISALACSPKDLLIQQSITRVVALNTDIESSRILSLRPDFQAKATANPSLVKRLITARSEANFSKVCEIGREILVHSPLHMETHYSLALAYQYFNAIHDIVHHLKILSKYMPGFSGANKSLADFRWLELNLKEYAATFKGAVLGGKHDIIDEVRLEVECLYKDAIYHDFENTDYYNYYGNFLRDIGRLEDGILSYKSAVSLSPTNAIPYFNLALALEESGQFSAARAEVLRAIKLFPEFGEAYECLVRLSVRDNSYEDILENSSKALTCNRFFTSEAYL